VPLGELVKATRKFVLLVKSSKYSIFGDVLMLTVSTFALKETIAESIFSHIRLTLNHSR
jgi:hypothetical protein